MIRCFFYRDFGWLRVIFPHFYRVSHLSLVFDVYLVLQIVRDVHVDVHVDVQPWYRFTITIPIRRTNFFPLPRLQLLGFCWSKRLDVDYHIYSRTHWWNRIDRKLECSSPCRLLRLLASVNA